MRYVRAKWVEYQRELAYRIYVTDALYVMSNKGMSKRFYEIINPEYKDERSGDEIALDIIAKLGLKVE